jgi:hypothetical protein
MFHNARDFIFDICRHATDIEASKTAVLVWLLWQHRNNIVWNASNATAQQISLQACNYGVNGLNVTLFFRNKSSLRVNLQQTHPWWSGSSPRWVILNVTWMRAFTTRQVQRVGVGLFVIPAVNFSWLALI